MGEGSSSITIIITLALIVVVVIALVLWSTISSKRKKRDEVINKIMVDKKSSESIINIYKKLTNIVTRVETEMIDFKPSVGTTKMASINSEAKTLLKDMQKSQELADAKLDDQHKEDLNLIIKALVSNRPSAWHKNAFFEINLLKKRYHFLMKEIENKERIVKQINDSKTAKKSKTKV